MEAGQALVAVGEEGEEGGPRNFRYIHSCISRQTLCEGGMCAYSAREEKAARCRQGIQTCDG